MGKNLKGKECGKGIYQRKDGLYSARFYAKDGKRKEKYFDTLPAAKNWLADARYEERHSLIVTSPDMTVDKWFTGCSIESYGLKTLFVISLRTPSAIIESGTNGIFSRCWGPCA